MNYAFVATLCAMTSPVFAMPALTFVNNGNSTGTFRLAPDVALFPSAAGGSLAFEISVTVTGATIQAGTNGALFPTANPGDIGVGGLFNGVAIAGNVVRGAYGSNLFTTGTAVDAFTVDLSAGGTFTYLAEVAQNGTKFDFNGSGAITNAVAGDFNADGKVDNGDLNLLLGSWGAATVPPTWVNGFVSPVDNGELNDLLGNWGFGVGVAVPEPASALLVTLAGVAACGLRRRV
ncbi:PEP-CTERM sorting domain-containing protein [Botrimarina hoheduenensis]|nr:PEP-CTERM sorting domain-containing protein [Botrimarina hoheduenensis]